MFYLNRYHISEDSTSKMSVAMRFFVANNANLLVFVGSTMNLKSDGNFYDRTYDTLSLTNKGSVGYLYAYSKSYTCNKVNLQ